MMRAFLIDVHCVQEKVKKEMVREAERNKTKSRKTCQYYAKLSQQATSIRDLNRNKEMLLSKNFAKDGEEEETKDVAILDHLQGVFGGLLSFGGEKSTWQTLVFQTLVFRTLFFQTSCLLDFCLLAFQSLDFCCANIRLVDLCLSTKVVDICLTGSRSQHGVCAFLCLGSCRQVVYLQGNIDYCLSE